MRKHRDNRAGFLRDRINRDLKKFGIDSGGSHPANDDGFWDVFDNKIDFVKYFRAIYAHYSPDDWDQRVNLGINEGIFIFDALRLYLAKRNVKIIFQNKLSDSPKNRFNEYWAVFNDDDESKSWVRN